MTLPGKSLTRPFRMVTSKGDTVYTTSLRRTGTLPIVAAHTQNQPPRPQPLPCMHIRWRVTCMRTPAGRPQGTVCKVASQGITSSSVVPTRIQWRAARGSSTNQAVQTRPRCRSQGYDTGRGNRATRCHRGSAPVPVVPRWWSLGGRPAASRLTVGCGMWLLHIIFLTL